MKTQYHNSTAAGRLLRDTCHAIDIGRLALTDTSLARHIDLMRGYWLDRFGRISPIGCTGSVEAAFQAQFWREAGEARDGAAHMQR